jgi:hypothetical protein
MKSLFIGIFLVVLLAVAAILMGLNETGDSSINSYEECVARGYPVLESYPPQCKTRDGKSFAQDIGNELELTDTIRMTTPRPQTIVGSPLTIEGEARGTWFFEASFPVKLVDANETVIVEHYATAQGEWMTEAFVPFTTTLSFPTPETATGTLILMRDNPSGLPEHDQELRLPVRFNLENPTMAVKVYFGNENTMDAFGEGDCSAVESLRRIVPKTDGVARSALEELLKGPTQGEAGQGYFTSLPLESGVKLVNLSIENGTATAEFNEALESGVAGSCRVTHIRAQIESTLKQFEAVQNVVISIDGRTDDILQP